MKEFLKLKKILPLFIGLLFVVTSFFGSFAPIFNGKNSVSAAATWDDFCAKAPFSQTGEENDPIIISTKFDLANLSWLSRDDVSEVNNKHYKLMSDLDMGEYPFIPIGSSGSQAEGIVFDGGNHIIENLVIDSTSNCTGLFGSLYLSTVQNLTLKNVSISSSGQSTGAVAGVINSCNFENITIDGGTVSGSMNGVGGLVGAINGFETSFINCVNKATVTATSGDYTGGLFGVAYAGDLVIQNCENSGAISGIAYVAGIGSAGSTSAATFDLKECVNKGIITSLVPIKKYFAGLIAYASTNFIHRMENCYNASAVYAPYGTNVAGLVGYGKFNINNCFNTDAGIITGGNMVAGLAAEGIYNITESHNSGAVKAMSNNGNAIAAGIIGLLSRAGTVVGSYNKGKVEVVYTGISAGIVGTFAETSAGTYNVVADCYNWGEAAYAFIGSSTSRQAVVTNSYNRFTASITDNTNIKHTLVYNYSSMSPIQAIYENLSEGNPDVWGSDVGYNQGFPYLRSGQVSEIVIDANGGTLTTAHKLFYVNDLGATPENLNGISFAKQGYTFSGFDGGNIIAYDSPLKTIVANYGAAKYFVSASVEPLGSGTVSRNGSDTQIQLGFGSDIEFVASTGIGEEFAYWALEWENTLYEISDSQTLILDKDLIEFIISTYPQDDESTYQFVAVFQESWMMHITLVSGNKSWGKLEYSTDNIIFTPISLNSTSFRIPSTTRDVYLKLTAEKYYRIQSFGMAVTNNGNGSGNTLFPSFEHDDNVIIRRVTLDSNIEISIGFAKVMYKFEVSSIYDNDTPTGENLVIRGSNISFAVDQRISASSIAAKTEDIDGYRFIGFKYLNADGTSYNDIDTMTLGEMDFIDIDSKFLADYLHADKTVKIFAVYKKQFEIRMVVENGDLGACTLNGESVSNGFSDYYDEGISVSVIPVANENCEWTLDLPSASLNNSMTVNVKFEKIKYYIEVYGITYNYVSNDFEKIELDNLTVAKSEAASGSNPYVCFDSELYIINILGYLSNQVSEGWCYEIDGEYFPISESFINNDGDIYIQNIGISTINLWKDASDGNKIKIVAKVSEAAFLDINLSSENQKRGGYSLDAKYEGATNFVDAKNKNIFKIGTEIRVKVYCNDYFVFAGFEDANGNPIAANGTLSYTFTLLENQIISIYFDAEPVVVNLNSPTVENGKATITSSGQKAGEIQIGDSIVISFNPDSNYQLKSLTVNGRTIPEVTSTFNARRIGDTLIIVVDNDFLGWINEYNGEVNVIVTTELSTLFLVIIIAIGVLVPTIAVVIFIFYRSNAKRRKQFALIQKRQAQTKAGYDAVSKLSELTKEVDK